MFGVLYFLLFIFEQYCVTYGIYILGFLGPGIKLGTLGARFNFSARIFDVTKYVMDVDL